ncbi:hypothetical protein Tco_0414062 [Tanacetum coccineum]
MIHTQCNAWYEKLEKETQNKISNLEECVRIKDRQHIIRANDANDDFIIFENLRAQVNELQSENENLKSKVVECTMCQNLRTQVKELQNENEHLKSKVVVCTMCQNFQVQVEELKSVNESLNLSVEEFDSEIVLDTQDNSEKDLILSLQTQVKETAELVVRYSDEKYFALKEIKSLKDEIKGLQIENQDLKSRESELNTLEKVYETKESVLLKDVDQMKS